MSPDPSDTAALLERFSAFLSSRGAPRKTEPPPGVGPEFQVWAGVAWTQVEMGEWTALAPIRTGTLFPASGMRSFDRSSKDVMSEAIATLEERRRLRLTASRCGKLR